MMDKLLISLCVVTLLLKIARTERSEYPSNDAIIRRLDQLEEKVEILTNEVRRLKLEKQQNCIPVQSTNTNSVEPAVNALPGKELKVLEAQRERVADGIMFTVRYVTDGRHSVVAEWIEDPHGKRKVIPGTAHDLGGKKGPGVHETRVTVKPNENENPNIALSLVEFSSALYMEFKINITDQVIRDIKLPVLKWTPPGDIVYEHGQNVSIKLELPPLEDENLMRGTHFVLLDPERKNNVIVSATSSALENFAVPGNVTKLLDTSESEVTFTTSKYPTRGFIIVTSGNRSDDSMFDTIIVEKLITLRASDQTGPFPPGLLTTALFGQGQYEDGQFIGACDLDQESMCRVTCYGVGMGVKTVTVRKHTPDGGSLIIRSEDISLKNALLPVFLKFQETTPGNVTYTCEAVANDGRSSEETFVMQHIKTSIVDEESRARWINDTTMEFKCVFRSMLDPDNFAITWRYNIGNGKRKVRDDNIQAVGSLKFSSTTYVNVRYSPLRRGEKTAICKVHDRYDRNSVYARSKNLLELPKAK